MRRVELGTVTGPSLSDRRFLLQMPSEARDNLKTLDRPLNVSTMCSGSEVIMVVVRILRNLIGLKVTHILSCENDAEKQRWISTYFAPRRLFADMAQMGQESVPPGRARCLLSPWRSRGRVRVAAPRLAQESAVDALTGVMELVEGSDLCIGGWSCKSISALNARGKLNRSCCADVKGSTGITFEGIRQYVARHRPCLGLFENVMAVAAAGLCNGTGGRQSGRPARGSDDAPVASAMVIGPCE